MSSSTTKRVAVVPLGEDTDSVRRASQRSPGSPVLGPWRLRELVFAGSSAALALCAMVYFGHLADPGRYWSAALLALPLLAAAWMLLGAVLPWARRRVAGLDADQWATAISLNALIFAIFEAARDMGPLIGACVIFAAGMTAATAFARLIPAFASGQPGSAPAPVSAPAPAPSAAHSPSPSAASMRTTTMQRPSPSPAETRAIPVPERRSASRPFWFAVPARREVTDPRSGVVVGYAEPGVWILAREDRGTSFLVELEGGRRGLLADVTGIERA